MSSSEPEDNNENGINFKNIAITLASILVVLFVFIKIYNIKTSKKKTKKT